MIKYALILIPLLFIPNVFALTPKCDGVTDDTLAIQSEINNKNASLPYGSCIISSTLYLGNGTNSTQSTINDLFLTGKGFETGGDINNNWYFGGTRLVWNGPINGTMIAVRGPIHDIELSKINLDGNDKAGTCIYTTQMVGSDYTQVRCDRWTKTAYVFTVNATSSIYGVAHGMCQNEFNQISTDAPTNSKANGMFLNGSTSLGLDSCQNQFNQIQLVYGGASGSCGITLGMADNNNFNTGMLYPSYPNTGGHSVCFKQTGNSFFPGENWFNGLAIVQGISGTSGQGGNWFMPYPTQDGEPIPNIPYVHYVLYNGTIR